MKLFIGVLFFLTVSVSPQAHATTILLDDFGIGSSGPGFGQADWFGVFNVFPNFIVTMPIGNCDDPDQCDYDRPADIGFNPGTTQAISGYVITTPQGSDNGQGRFDWHPDSRTWSTQNIYDATLVRVGSYCVVGIDAGCGLIGPASVPEPSALWLIVICAGIVMAGTRLRVGCRHHENEF